MPKVRAAAKPPMPVAQSPTLGEAIRKMRGNARLKLLDAAKRAGVSASYLSQVEHDRICPSVAGLGRITEALNTTVAALFAEIDGSAQTTCTVVRRNERKGLFYPGSTARNELLVPNLRGALEVIWSRIPPGAKSRVFRHEGEECGVILSGELTYWVSDEKFILRRGDSITYKSRVPHRFENRTRQVVQTIWIITPPGF